jgi:hypothetical protein
VIPLSNCGAVPGSLDAAALLDTAMVLFDAPQVKGVLRTLSDAHPQVAGGPVFNAAVWGSHLEHFDEAVSLQMNDGAMVRNQHCTDRSVARTIWINQAIGFQLGQPLPVQRAHQLQVLQTGIPAVEAQQLGMKSPLCRYLHHRLEVIVLGQPVVRFVVDAKVTGQVGFPICPQHADQIDPQDHPMMFARPVAGYQLDGPAVRLVQRRVVDDQKALGQRNTGLHLLPQGVSIRLTPVQQTRVGIMRRTIRVGRRMASRCFCVAEHVLRCYQKVDIVQFVTLRRVHRLKYTPSGGTA